MIASLRSWVSLSLSFSRLRGCRVGASALVLIAMLVASGCGKDDSDDAYNNRGVAWDSKGEYDRAIEDYTGNNRWGR